METNPNAEKNSEFNFLDTNSAKDSWDISAENPNFDATSEEIDDLIDNVTEATQTPDGSKEETLAYGEVKAGLTGADKIAKDIKDELKGYHSNDGSEPLNISDFTTGPKNMTELDEPFHNEKIDDAKAA